MDNTPVLIPNTDIIANKYQPRINPDPLGIIELAANIRENRTNSEYESSRGLLQIPQVRKNKDGKYELVFGHRRFASFVYLSNSFKDEEWGAMPCIAVELTDKQMYLLMAAENGNRVDLKPIEKAESILRGVDEHGLTQEEAGKAHGINNKGAVSNLVFLLSLPDAIKRMVNEGELPQPYARELRPLLKYDPPQIEFAIQIAKDALANRGVMKFDAYKARIGTHLDSLNRPQSVVEEAPVAPVAVDVEDWKPTNGANGKDAPAPAAVTIDDLIEAVRKWFIDMGTVDPKDQAKTIRKIVTRSPNNQEGTGYFEFITTRYFPEGWTLGDANAALGRISKDISLIAVAPKAEPVTEAVAVAEPVVEAGVKAIVIDPTDEASVEAAIEQLPPQNGNTSHVAAETTIVDLEAAAEAEEAAEAKLPQPSTPNPTCPKCNQDRVVGVNGQGRWCLHCNAKWDSLAELMTEINGPIETEAETIPVRVVIEIDHLDMEPEILVNRVFEYLTTLYGVVGFSVTTE